MTLSAYCTVGDCTVQKCILILTGTGKGVGPLVGILVYYSQILLVNLIAFTSCQSQDEDSQISMRFSVNKGTRTWSLASILQGLEQ